MNNKRISNDMDAVHKRLLRTVYAYYAYSAMCLISTNGCTRSYLMERKKYINSMQCVMIMLMRQPATKKNKCY